MSEKSPYRGLKPPSVFEDAAAAPAPAKVPPHLDPAHPDARPAGAEPEPAALPPVFSDDGEGPRPRGARDLVVPLRVPVEHDGRTVAEIALRPVTLGDLADFSAGGISGGLAGLLARLSGEPEAVLRLIEYPDSDLVLAALLAHVPPAIRQAVERA